MVYGVVEEEAVVIKLTMKLLKNEDEQNLKILNEVLIAKRKSPFVMPPEGSAVIVLFSGGIDSVSLVSLLIEKYNYKVYPLYYKLNIINTNQYKAIDYFDKYFWIINNHK